MAFLHIYSRRFVPSSRSVNRENIVAAAISQTKHQSNTSHSRHTRIKNHLLSNGMETITIIYRNEHNKLEFIHLFVSFRFLPLSLSLSIFAQTRCIHWLFRSDLLQFITYFALM